ncbi:phytoene/squalene synthase family protein [uncultured Fibrobacter sp.]|uniref:phytoene/squalene synthase family protein n=1 Tax=uncultured Fibrobacter sp. TaxID=261512 RepID=UPI002601B072|nr:phytoene/squalene synthase family protein [uncultured Fibrobacter sp.]
MSNILESIGVGESVLDGRAAWKYAEEILLLVSRTFALNINILKGKLHKSILLAYLYLRIADTVEDDPDMKASEKEIVLGKFAEIFKTSELPDDLVSEFERSLPESWRKSEHPYMNLCLHTHVVVPLLKELPEVYAAPVRAVTIEMCHGMAKFALRQEAALSSGWFTLESVADLDEYCYYVAGIVGKLLTNLFAADTCLISDARRVEMQKLDVSFGLALQVANIVKDCVEDSGRRVCFVPEEICRRHGFAHSYEMFDVPADAAAKVDFNKRRAAVMGELVKKAWGHLDDAIAYTKLIPNVKMRTRLFCLWPLFMAAENMKLIGDGSSLFASEKKVKITRDTVKRIIKSTMLHFYSDSWIEKSYAKLKREAEAIKN